MGIGSDHKVEETTWGSREIRVEIEVLGIMDNMSREGVGELVAG